MEKPKGDSTISVSVSTGRPPTRITYGAGLGGGGEDDTGIAMEGIPIMPFMVGSGFPREDMARPQQSNGKAIFIGSKGFPLCSFIGVGPQESTNWITLLMAPTIM